MAIEQAEILNKEVKESRLCNYVLVQERKVELRSRTHKQVSAQKCASKIMLVLICFVEFTFGLGATTFMYIQNGIYVCVVVAFI